MYDADVAEAVRQRFAAGTVLKTATLWVTVQRRIVWVEGCVQDSNAAPEIARLLKDVPDAEQVIVNVHRAGSVRPPYAVTAD